MTTSVVDVATLFPASLIGTALSRLWVADSPQNHLVPALDECGTAATCPISLAPFENPVLLADGIVYEENDICQWLQNHTQAPCTNAILDHRHVLRLEPFREAIEYFLLRSSSNLDSQSASSLQHALDDALQTDTPINVRVERLRSAMLQAQVVAEALSSSISGARILLVQLSAELSSARNAAATVASAAAAAGRLQRWWRRRRARHSLTMLEQTAAFEDRQRRNEHDIERELRKALAESKKKEILKFQRDRRDAVEKSAGYGSTGSSPTKSKQSTAESLAGVVAQQEELHSPSIPFSISQNRVDANNGAQACASCGNSDVLLFACKRCQSEHYCSFHCQRRRWDMHKAACGKHRKAATSPRFTMDCGDTQATASHMPGSASSLLQGSTSSRNSMHAASSSMPSSSTSSRDFASCLPSGTSLVAPGSRDTLQEGPPPQRFEAPQRRVEEPSGAVFGAVFSTPENVQSASPDRRDYQMPPTTIPCVDCGRLYWKRPPGGICDDCFRSHSLRGSFPAHHCIAYCHRCARITDKVLDPIGHPCCAYCTQVVEPTCGVWRDSYLTPSPQDTQSSTNFAQPETQVSEAWDGSAIEPPRVECNLSSLLADLGEQVSANNSPNVDQFMSEDKFAFIPDSPGEPLVRIPFIRDSPGEPLVRIPEAYAQVPQVATPGVKLASVPAANSPNLKPRLQQLQQLAGLESTGNLITDVRQLASTFGVPFTTLQDVIASCEAALSEQRGLEGGHPHRATNARRG